MKYLLPFLALVVVGCGESIEPGTPVSSITICTQPLDEYFDCEDKEVVDVAAVISAPDVDNTGFITEGNCYTIYIDESEGVVVGDELEVRTRFAFADGSEDITQTHFIMIDDTAASFIVPCPD
jgi:hypothetical protein